MLQTQITCIKYNYSLDKVVQNFTCFEATLSLDKKMKFIIQIYKPKEKTSILGNPTESEDEDIDIDFKDQNRKV